jgi:hypothetical protein
MLKFNRRFLLSRAAVLPAAATLASAPLVPALAAPAVHDPILAAIASHRDAVEAYEEMFGINGTVRHMVDPEYWEKRKAAEAAKIGSLHALMLARPTTVGGVIAALDHVGIPVESMSYWRDPANWLDVARSSPQTKAEAILFLPAIADALREMAEVAALAVLPPLRQSAVMVTTSVIAEHDRTKDDGLFRLIDDFNAADVEADRAIAIEERYSDEFITRQRMLRERKGSSACSRRSSAHAAATRVRDEAVDRANTLLDEIAAMPAQTWRGVAAKARLAKANELPDTITEAAINDMIALADGMSGGVS